MKISKDTWHYRAFNFWHKEKYHWTFEEYHGDGAHTSLCPYVRAVLLWAPIRWVFTAPRIFYLLGVIAAGLLSELYHFHGKLGLEILGLVIVAIASIFAIVFGISVGLRLLIEKWEEKPITAFTTVLIERVRAAHQGICPFIEFVESPQNKE
jgi:hypothetical protein